jgi:hypothetical protein
LGIQDDYRKEGGRMMRKVVTVICKNENCKKKFKKWSIARKVHRGSERGIRGANAVTCSRRCSREYNRTRQEKSAGVIFKRCAMCGKEVKAKKLDVYDLCPSCQEFDII